MSASGSTSTRVPSTLVGGPADGLKVEILGVYYVHTHITLRGVAHACYGWRRPHKGELRGRLYGRFLGYFDRRGRAVDILGRKRRGVCLSRALFRRRKRRSTVSPATVLRHNDC